MANKILKSEEIGGLYFGQLHYFHQAFFDKYNCQHTRIPLREMPHYKVLRDGQLSKKSNVYNSYLKQSWKHYFPSSNTRAKRDQRIAYYKALLDDIKINGVNKPIIITDTCDGGRVIVDGNHRACVAYHLGIDIPFEYISTKDAIQRIVNNAAEFYGTKNKGAPYQSIFYGDKLLLPGRRQDIHARFMKILIQDIRGKKVLDLGANIGVNASLAWYYGAKEVTAMEVSPKIASSALRLSTLLGSRIELKVQDLGERIPGRQKYDTVFCLSLHAHVKDRPMLEKNILRVTKPGSVLYFEGHEKSEQDDYRHILNHFNDVKLIGYNQDGIHSKKSTRPFFRCVR